MIKDFFISIFDSIIKFSINILGGWDIWLTSLVFLIVINIIVEIVRYSLFKTDKGNDKDITFDLFKLFRCGVRKILILIVVAIGTRLDQIVTPNNEFIRYTVIGYYIASETISILENAGACGIPLPKILYNVLDNLKNENMKRK